MTSFKQIARVVVASIAAGVIAFSQVTPAFAAVVNPVPGAAVSFTFDDGLATTLTQAQPVMAKYGITGTDYVITGCVGMATTPNTCHANTGTTYMTWAQVQQLQAAGWEIGSHTVSHPYLATSDAKDGQPNVLTPAQVDQELSQSKAALAAHGIDAKSFASPYGDYNNATLAVIAKYYADHRGFADVNNNDWPYNDYLLHNFPVQAGVTVAQVKAKIDQAIASKQWLALTFHDIKVSPSTNPSDYEYKTADLDQIAAYVKSKQDAGLLKSTNVYKGLVTSDTNMLANSSFDSGLANGWTTNNAAAVKLDTAGNGSYNGASGPTNSVKMTAGASNAFLFSPKVAVSNTQTYMLKSFLNVTTHTSGEIGYYVDEYNASGQWVSGQWKTAETTTFVESINFTYTPTSASIKQASLQVYVLGGSGITAYVDNFQMFPLSGTPPVVTPPNNLVANGTFDAGIANGWTTNDAANIKANASNHGSNNNPVNSVSLTAGTQNRHLFGPHVAVSAAHSYGIHSFLNLTHITSGEVGFYIDEYDASGNWISGQYKTGVNTVSAADVNLSYFPSSANVASASLQVIVMGNSGTTAYFDDVRWYQDNN